KEDETVNSMIPIWKRRKSEVSDEEYNEFYKSQFHDFTDPARVVSVHAEGGISYDVLLFIPGRAPFDLYSKEYQRGLQLYSSNVLIMEKCEDLVPECFGFVQGVVDSQDLTLNISRETLQQNRQLRAIANKVEKKIKSELAAMRDKDREAYETFHANFGRSLKFGIYSSYGMRKDLLADLLLFYSAKQQKMITLDEYLASEAEVATVVGEESEAPKAIYYAAGEQLERLGKLPLVKAVLDKGHDVLLCTAEEDEFVLGTMIDYKEHEFKNVMSDDLGLESESDKAAAEAAAKLNEGLIGAMKDALGDKVAKVEVSTRLGDSAAVVTAEGPISLEMERIMAQMPGADMGGLTATRVLEVNAEHPVFEVLKSAQEAGDADKVKLYTEILYDQALLVNGLELDDPADYAQKIFSLMK
ncbi:MAG: molecular chaperone HtpG, partial [Coriobacteriia bacterium]|nr:molecular chaperone HtpG [Coriobacteriia bacterium]